MKRLRLLPLMAVFAMLCTCASVPNKPARLSPDSYGCMQKVVAEKLPAHLPDKRAHCLAAGLIARYCSRTEAYIAGAGKEFRDLFTPRGDAEWADWRADRVGIQCARNAVDAAALESCCTARGYPP